MIYACLYGFDRVFSGVFVGHFPYIERLEITAQQLAGKRNYQECHNLHEKHLSSFRYSEDQTIEQQVHCFQCSFCGLSFDLDSKADKKEHRKRHKLFEAAYYSTGYNPDCYVIREKKKDAAKKKYSSLSPCGDEAAKSEIGMVLCKRFYDRSFEKAILCDYWDQHPSFEQYVAMLEIQNGFEPGVLEILRRKFGVIKGHIPPGHSY